MKKPAWSGTFIIGLMAACTHADLVFDDVDVFASAGSGANEALLLLDWNPTPDPGNFAFTYRWDGTASALDVLQGLDAALTRLEVNYHPNFPNAVFGIGLDTDGDGGSFTPGIPQDAPGGSAGSENGSASDADDAYAEGWFSGYWAFYRGFDNGSDGINWTSQIDEANFYSPTDLLPDGAWAAFSYAPAFDTASNPPVLPGVVPEPTTALLLLWGAALLLRRLRR